MSDAAVPYYAVIPIHPGADAPVLSKGETPCPSWLSFSDTSHITLSAPGTYLIYYYAVSTQADIAMSLAINGAEIPPTYDCGRKICGGAVSMPADTAKSICLSLLSHSDPSVFFYGFLLVAKI